MANRCYRLLRTSMLAYALLLLIVPHTSFAQTFTRDLYLGSIGEDVRALQQFLNNDEFFVAKEGPGSPGNETDYFGYATRDTLMRFQTYYGISPNIGYFGPLTRSVVTAPTFPFTRTLELGARGNDVALLQQFLRDQDFFDYPENTGYFGPLTQAAVQAYQAAQGIVSDGTPQTTGFGRVGPLTRDSIIRIPTGAPTVTLPSSPEEPRTIPDRHTPGTFDIWAPGGDWTPGFAAGGARSDDAAETDIEPPTVSLTAPADNAIVSGNVTISASASDNVGVVGVEFKLDTNTLLGDDTAPPYSMTWDSTTVNDGEYSLIAVARDAAGNRATSSARIVTVDNVTFSVEDQTLAFGALTLAGAGGVAPIATGGNITAAEITNGNDAGHWQVASDGMITPTAAGESADLSAGPYTLNIAFQSGVENDDASITVNTISDARSVRTITEMITAAEHADLALGQEILLRNGPPGDWNSAQEDLRIVRSSSPIGTFVEPSLIDPDPTYGGPDKGSDLDTANFVVIRPHGPDTSPTIGRLSLASAGGPPGDPVAFYFRFTELVFSGGILRALEHATHIAIDGVVTDSRIALTRGSDHWLHDNTASNISALEPREVVGNIARGLNEDSFRTNGDVSNLLFAWNQSFDKEMPEGDPHPDFWQPFSSAFDPADIRVIGNRFWRGAGTPGEKDAQGYFVSSVNTVSGIVMLGNMYLGTFANGLLVKNSSDGVILNNTIINDPIEVPGKGTAGIRATETATDNTVRDNITHSLTGWGGDPSNDLGNNSTISLAAYADTFVDPQSDASVTDLAVQYAIRQNSPEYLAHPRRGAAGTGYIDYENRTHDFPQLETGFDPDGLFIDVTDAQWDAEVTSNEVTVSGVSETGVLVRVFGGTFRVRDGSDTLVRDFSADDYVVPDGYKITLRRTAASTPETPVEASVIAGVHSTTWTVTTEAGSGVVFPNPVASTMFETRHDGLVRTVPLPDDIAAGQLLVLAGFTTNTSGNPSLPAGWTIRESGTRHFLATKVAEGGEESVDVTFEEASPLVAIAWQIENWEDAITDAELGIDPPELVFDWDDKTLVLVFVASRRSDWVITDPPAGYGGLIQIHNPGSESFLTRAGIGSAHRQVTGEAEDPGPFTIDGTTSAPVAMIIAIRGIFVE